MQGDALARSIRAVGLGAFPCSETKTPAIPKNTSWGVWAFEPIEALPWRSGLVGVPVPPGLVVLDLDTYKGATREQVEIALGVSLEWEDALIQHTMQGGQHYAFKVGWNVRFGSNMAGVRGLDTRTYGKGYIATGPGYSPVGGGVHTMADAD
ncbi:unnamed protein product, partial [marine sediment metagenome]